MATVPRMPLQLDVDDASSCWCRMAETVPEDDRHRILVDHLVADPADPERLRLVTASSGPDQPVGGSSLGSLSRAAGRWRCATSTAAGPPPPRPSGWRGPSRSRRPGGRPREASVRPAARRVTRRRGDLTGTAGLRRRPRQPRRDRAARTARSSPTSAGASRSWTALRRRPLRMVEPQPATVRVPVMPAWMRQK